MLHTLVSVLAGGPGLDRTMDLDAFNAAEVARLARLPAAQLIAQFEEDCAALTVRVAQLTRDDLTRRCWHPWLGGTTVGETLRLAYRHTMVHVRDMRRAVAGRGPEAQGHTTRGAGVKESGTSRATALSLFLREAHAQSWPHLVRLAEQAGAVLVYPGQPGWTVPELLAHLADAERGMLGQAQRMVRGEPARRRKACGRGHSRSALGNRECASGMGPLR
ncbi:MAG: maleylpyruvate isomerase N-terminal domain-containing protein [Chloroflexi bacterium]|nr:maleylpyruvate isomerase N-terminal domain-containing protein [Chloroflexota bacterium]